MAALDMPPHGGNPRTGPAAPTPSTAPLPLSPRSPFTSHIRPGHTRGGEEEGGWKRGRPRSKIELEIERRRAGERESERAWLTERKRAPPSFAPSLTSVALFLPPTFRHHSAAAAASAAIAAAAASRVTPSPPVVCRRPVWWPQ